MRFVVPIALAVAFVGSVRSADVPRGPDQPKKSAQVTEAMLRNLIGKGHFSDEACQLRKLLEARPIASCHVSFEKSFHHMWMSEGLEVSFDNRSKAVCCFLYAEGLDGHRQYAGELPAKLAFGDSPATVRKNLGAPGEVIDSTKEDGTKESHWSYLSLGLSVRFGSDTADTKAKLELVIIHAVEKAK